MYFIKNADIVLENGILWDGSLITDGDRIAAIGKKLDVPDGATVIDAHGAYIGPGFVDIHVHGGGGALFCDDISAATEHFLKHGETTILPTLYYNMTQKQLLDGFVTVRDAMEKGGIFESIAGINMEGPYMNPKYGAMPEKNVWRGEIKREEYMPLLQAGKGLVKIWSIAPEREGIEGFLSDLRSIDRDAVISFGHCEALPSEVRILRKYGIRLQTHSMNATGRLERRRGVRDFGPDEACMLDSDIYAELICDSQAIHVAPEMQQLLLKNKTVDKVVLITDCNVSNDKIPEMYKDVPDLLFDVNGRLNGSSLTMNTACKNIMTHTSCGIAQAFNMASRNPARVVGLDGDIGTLEVGKKADIVFVDDRFNVLNVMLKGKMI